MTETTTTVSARKKQPALLFKAGADVQAHRKKLGLNQSEFWSRINVTQSGGSRYESGGTSQSLCSCFSTWHTEQRKSRTNC